MKLYENIKIPDKDSLDGARTLPFEVRQKLLKIIYEDIKKNGD